MSEGRAAFLIIARVGQDHGPIVVRQTWGPQVGEIIINQQGSVKATSPSVGVGVAPGLVVVAAVVVLLVGGITVLGLHDQAAA